MYRFCCTYIDYCANFSDASKMVNKSHPHLFLIDSSLMSLFATDFNIKKYRLFFHYAFECPVILKLCLCVSYHSQNYMPAKLVTYNSQSYASTLGSGLDIYNEADYIKTCILANLAWPNCFFCAGALL